METLWNRKAELQATKSWEGPSRPPSSHFRLGNGSPAVWSHLANTVDPLVHRGYTQDPQWMLETTRSTEPHIYDVFSYTYL